jgi:uroporphyrinogen-III decarboxylase
VGSPWTLATYLIEGGSTPLYKKIKAMTAAAPDVLSALLQHLAVQIAEYMCFQASQSCGASHANKQQQTACNVNSARLLE